MCTDKCADIFAHMDMITPTKAFSLVQRIKYWLLTTFQIRFQHSFNHLYHECTNALAHTCWRWSLQAFSLIIAVQILIAEPLDKWLKKRYNTTTLIGWSCESDHIGWPLILIKNHPLPMRPKPSIWERIFTTTYATIDTTGAPGDKMPRERERSFLP